ncbi:MAG: hypothetical protein R3F11_13560 [Verrucomicrobiales bacterium]
MRASLTLAIFAAAPSFAAEPKCDYLFPAGVQRGGEIEVEAGGAFDPWPPQVWVSDPALAFSPKDEKGKFAVRAKAEAEPGPKLVRFFNAEGASALRVFVVGEDREIMEGDAKDPIGAGQLPMVINGRLEGSAEIDQFALALAAEAPVDAAVAGYALDSPMDPLLHLRDARGAQLAYNHDGTTVGLDPRLVLRAPADGTYTLLLSAFAYPPQANIRFTGGKSAVYRLRLSLAGPPPADPNIPTEAEPNDAPEQAMALELPAEVAGQIGAKGDRDCFRIAAKAGEWFRLEARAAEAGFLTDPVLRLLDADGKQLAEFDDLDAKEQHDAAADWKAPADGAFTLEVRDRNRRGGADYGYRLSAARRDPAFEVEALASAWKVAPGGKVDVKAKVAKRFGYAEKLKVWASDLPEGVTAAPAEPTTRARPR